MLAAVPCCCCCCCCCCCFLDRCPRCSLCGSGGWLAPLVVVDLLSLGIGKGKALRELREEGRGEERNLENYVGKVIGKLDRLTAVL